MRAGGAGREAARGRSGERGMVGVLLLLAGGMGVSWRALPVPSQVCLCESRASRTCAARARTRDDAREANDKRDDRRRASVPTFARVDERAHLVV
ncbi:hypothetical protein BJY59DRAFT_703596, partial [Rhodotorula toruloides]